MQSSLRLRLGLPLMTLFYLGPTLWSQGQPGGTIEPVRMINASKDPLLAGFRFRSIGPASMGGRIDDIAVFESDPSIIYLGYATAGVWKSVNAGTTFDSIFDEYPVASVGDLALHPTNPDILYVGTGEPNNRQTSTFGDGIYKTTDGGKTFSHIGLRETQTIARILIDPRNPETVYVAALGHLFGPNKERGVYKTTDGGKTWTNVKFIDENTGFTDIVMDPSNSNILYAASYQRRRSGCCFNGGGLGSGIWKTTDGGKNWTRLTGNGLPPGTYGRIALDVSRSNPNVIYAQIEAGEENRPMPQRGGGRGGGGGGRGGGGGGYDWCNNAGPNKGFGGRGAQADEQDDQPRTPPALDPARGGIFRSDNKGAGWLHLSNCNARPMYFSQIRVDPSNDKIVYVAGLPIAKSLDGGKTFATLNDAGGHGSPGHVDQHAIWIDPKNPKHLLIGNDGGLNISWDQGTTWDFVDTMATAQAYWVSADMRRPYFVYIGLQDNGSWGGPSATRNNEGILNSDWFGIGGGDGFQTAVDPTDYNIVYTESQNGNTNRYDLRKSGSVSIRPRAPGGRGTSTTGPESQEGAEAGRTPAQQAQQQQQQQQQAQQQGGGGRGNQPPNVLNARPGDQYRFNWNTPFMLSPHNPSMIWLGGNRLFSSTNRGDTWVASEDLTKGIDRNQIAMMGVPGDRTMLSKNDGVSAYSTITSLSESPVVPGIVWVGTDDGNVQVSRDGGSTFIEVGKNMPGLPQNHRHWISRIDASHFDAATAYVSIDGHRDDDLKPYLYVTRDYGKSWQSITGDLPPFGHIQVVREDPRNPDLLYVGTEFGLYISLDRGRSWQKFMNNLPTARVDDILVHPRDNDLIVATHARGVWILDDISPLQQMTPAMTSQDTILFDVRPAVAYINDRQSGQYVGGQKHYIGENPPRGASINYYLKNAAAGDVRITISDLTGRELRTITGTGNAGINRVIWNLTETPPEGQRGGRSRGGGGRGGGGQAVDPGTYVVTLEVGGRRQARSVTVLEDVWLSQK